MDKTNMAASQNKHKPQSSRNMFLKFALPTEIMVKRRRRVDKIERK
jgi:hypothetical protein